MNVRTTVGMGSYRDTKAGEFLDFDCGYRGETWGILDEAHCERFKGIYSDFVRLFTVLLMHTLYAGVEWYRGRRGLE